MHLVELVFVLGAGPGFGLEELELAAAGAGRQWDAPVTRRFVPGDGVGVISADLRVIGRRETGDQSARAIGLALIIVVAVAKSVSQSHSVAFDSGEGYHSKSCLVQVQFSAMECSCWISLPL